MPLLFAEVKLVHSFPRQCVGEIVLMHFKILHALFCMVKADLLAQESSQVTSQLLEIVRASLLK
jgi:hypothetical protein